MRGGATTQGHGRLLVSDPDGSESKQLKKFWKMSTKTKITNYQTLLLEKQRLSLLCASQEKDMAANFGQLKKTLNPSSLMREAILEIIPREIRENKIISFFLSFLKSDAAEGDENKDIFSFAKTTVLTAALKYLDKFLSKN